WYGGADGGVSGSCRCSLRDDCRTPASRNRLQPSAGLMRPAILGLALCVAGASHAQQPKPAVDSARRDSAAFKTRLDSARDKVPFRMPGFDEFGFGPRAVPAGTTV